MSMTVMKGVRDRVVAHSKALPMAAGSSQSGNKLGSRGTGE